MNYVGMSDTSKCKIKLIFDAAFFHWEELSYTRPKIELLVITDIKKHFLQSYLRAGQKIEVFHWDFCIECDQTRSFMKNSFNHFSSVSHFYTKMG